MLQRLKKNTIFEDWKFQIHGKLLNTIYENICLEILNFCRSKNIRKFHIEGIWLNHVIEIEEED